MNYICINPGSSSLKYSVFDTSLTQLGQGKIAKKSQTQSIHQYQDSKSSIKDEYITNEFNIWLERMLEDVAHYMMVEDRAVFVVRVVHGCGEFSKPQLLDRACLTTLEENSHFAPLHLPLSIKVAQTLLDTFGKEVWGVFDTSFHDTIPLYAQHTGLPRLQNQDGKLRRYGFHGLSHSYCTQSINLIDTSNPSIITCHLGSGSSICAIENGKSIYTSMGYGTGTGLVMSTRAGDVDWEALLEYMEDNELTPSHTKSILMHNAGIIGSTGVTDSMLDVVNSLENKESEITFRWFVSRVAMTISSYLPLFTKPPSYLVFTGGIGENSSFIRSTIISYFDAFGWKISKKKNEAKLPDRSNNSSYSIQENDSKMRILVIPAFEEYQMAYEIKFFDK